MPRYVVSVTTSAGGDATAYTDSAVEGDIISVRYVPHASTPLDTGADVTITGADSGIPIITITNLGTSAVNYAPRQATHGITGTAALYAAGGLGVLDRIAISGELVKVVVAQGGNALSGKFHIVVS